MTEWINWARNGAWTYVGTPPHFNVYLKLSVIFFRKFLFFFYYYMTPGYYFLTGAQVLRCVFPSLNSIIS